MRAAIASPFGFLIGLSLGALGGGSAILTVPLLVYGLGLPPAAATTSSLLVVGPVAAWGAINHWRNDRVRLAEGVVFGLAGIGGSLAGSDLSRSVNPNVLLLLFSALMFAAALSTFQRVRKESNGSKQQARTSSGAALAAKVALAGTGVGFVTGFFGVGGGFVVVPALVLALGFSLPEAVGTSLVVIAINSAMALVPRIGAGDVPWIVVAPLLLAALFGAVAGSRAAGKADPETLAIIFAALVSILAAYTALRSVAGLM